MSTSNSLSLFISGTLLLGSTQYQHESMMMQTAEPEEYNFVGFEVIHIEDLSEDQAYEWLEANSPDITPMDRYSPIYAVRALMSMGYEHDQSSDCFMVTL